MNPAPDVFQIKRSLTDIVQMSVCYLSYFYYNIALLPIKALSEQLIYFLWKVMRYVTFELHFKSGQGLLVCF